VKAIDFEAREENMEKIVVDYTLVPALSMYPLSIALVGLELIVQAENDSEQDVILTRGGVASN
jgi:hypothetical protein